MKTERVSGVIVVESKELTEVVASVLGIDAETMSAIHEKTDLRNYNLGSIMAIELVVALEDRFQIVIPEEELTFENICTIERLKQLIERRKSSLGEG